MQGINRGCRQKSEEELVEGVEGGVHMHSKRRSKQNLLLNIAIKILLQEEELVEGVRETVLYKYASTVISAIQSLIQYKKRNWKKGVGERDVTICIHKV